MGGGDNPDDVALLAQAAKGVGGESARASRWWGVWDRSLEASRILARSATVSVIAHKNGGLSTHPIGRIIGKPIMGSSPYRAGISAPRMGIECSWNQTLMKASEMSTW